VLTAPAFLFGGNAVTFYSSPTSNSAMIFRRHIPAAPLSDFVEDLWLYENYTADHHLKERILPSGTIEMVFNLQDDELRIYDPERIDRYRRYSGALVSGTYGRCFVTDTAEEKSIMGVHFRPAGAFPFLGVAADDLAGVHLDLETLWGSGVRLLRERLCEATTPQQRFRILENALQQHLLRPLEHHYAVAAALHEFGQSSRPLVREVARDIGLSQRRLIRAFAEEAGLTPKMFGRIVRFQRTVMRASQKNAEADWSQLSLECGYCDQSHLINDFVEFSGLTPGEYMAQLQYLDRHGIRRKRNHVPVVRAA
jgi:AraC-like DNA-binding protein